jgi:hypothetical protein
MTLSEAADIVSPCDDDDDIIDDDIDDGTNHW